MITTRYVITNKNAPFVHSTELAQALKEYYAALEQLRQLHRVKVGRSKPFTWKGEEK